MARADEIAYNLARTDPMLSEAGLTQSWRAIAAFREGREAWRQYELTKDPVALAAGNPAIGG